MRYWLAADGDISREIGTIELMCDDDVVVSFDAGKVLAIVDAAVRANKESAVLARLLSPDAGQYAEATKEDKKRWAEQNKGRIVFASGCGECGGDIIDTGACEYCGALG